MVELLIAISCLVLSLIGLGVMVWRLTVALSLVRGELARYVSLLEPEPYPVHLRERPLAARPSRKLAPEAAKLEGDAYRDGGIVEDED